MFFETNDFQVHGVEVFKLKRDAYRKPSQIRPFHAISFRIYGDALYETQGDRITAQTGDILFVPAYVQYIKETRPECFYVVHFYCEKPIGQQLRRIAPADPERFRKLFDRLYRVQKEKRLAYEHACKSLLYEIITEIEREWSGANHSVIETEMNRAIRMIHESYTNPDFTVGSLSESLSMSEVYFRKQFRKTKGISPKRYISNLRLQTAKELLRSGYYSVSEVASRCGFSNSYYFSAFIKRETGKSPRQLMQVEEFLP